MGIASLAGKNWTANFTREIENRREVAPTKSKSRPPAALFLPCQNDRDTRRRETLINLRGGLGVHPTRFNRRGCMNPCAVGSHAKGQTWLQDHLGQVTSMICHMVGVRRATCSSCLHPICSAKEWVLGGHQVGGTEEGMHPSCRPGVDRSSRSIELDWLLPSI